MPSSSLDSNGLPTLIVNWRNLYPLESVRLHDIDVLENIFKGLSTKQEKRKWKKKQLKIV